MLLWIDGGKAGKLDKLGAEPSDALKTLAAVANAAGLPAAVVRQVPFQPMFDGLIEDDLIAHTFVEYARTGDPSWPLLLPMVKAAVEAMTAATAAARESWGLEIDGFVVTGASKRGWTTWRTAAVDERVRERFIARSRIIAAVRQVLAERGYLEVEGPTLQETAGGAAARPFTTHHNALDMPLASRLDAPTAPIISSSSAWLR